VTGEIVHGPNAPIEYTVGGWVTGVGGRPLRSRGVPTQTRVPARNMNVSGVCVPYDVPLDDNDGTKLIFNADTRWLLPGTDVPLQLEHGGALLGTARIDEKPTGLFATGTVFAERRPAVGNRHELSVGLTRIETRRLDGGNHLVTAASLREVSLTRRGRWWRIPT
jgi:hypothetical protein